MKKTTCIRWHKLARIFSAVAIFIIVLAVPLFAFAQNRWSVDVRPSVNFPVKNLAGADLNTGFGIEGSVLYRFMPHTSVYAGWGWNLFPEGEKNSDISNEETGYTFGLQFLHPIAGTNKKYYMKAGGIYNHVEVEKDDNIISDSGHELGWQVESGLSLPLNQFYSINPGLRYRELSGTTAINGIKSDFNLNYFSLTIGVVKTFR